MLTAPPRDADVPLNHPTLATEPVIFSWRVHLLPGQKRRLPRLIGVGVLVLAGGVLVFHSLLLVLFPLSALVFSLSEFLFPCRYTFTQHGAQARQGLMTLEIAWTDVQHAYLLPDGIKLSPLTRPGSRMEPLRGVFLRFADNEDQVKDWVQRLRREASSD